MRKWKQKGRSAGAQHEPTRHSSTGAGKRVTAYRGTPADRKVQDEQEEAPQERWDDTVGRAAKRFGMTPKRVFECSGIGGPHVSYGAYIRKSGGDEHTPKAVLAFAKELMRRSCDNPECGKADFARGYVYQRLDDVLDVFCSPACMGVDVSAYTTDPSAEKTEKRVPVAPTRPTFAQKLPPRWGNEASGKAESEDRKSCPNPPEAVKKEEEQESEETAAQTHPASPQQTEEPEEPPEPSEPPTPEAPDAPVDIEPENPFADWPPDKPIPPRMWHRIPGNRSARR